MIKHPFKNPWHRHDDKSMTGDSRPTSWIKREDAAISHGRSSLFFIAHDNPSPPSVTCLQGHDILPGETTCSQGHPIG
ncbi:hypothetical protein ACFVTM_04775 [Arthrobacter sp. NPDC058130]|uniref:hypothetical protein n=1 Tax=Arthrobacter sp. NPDC058130 TaxID=3346353 RepID=UPI0036E279C7